VHWYVKFYTSLENEMVAENSECVDCVYRA